MAGDHKGIDLRSLADRLLAFDENDFQSHVPLAAEECLAVCQMALESWMSPVSPGRHELCISVRAPVAIVGDLHGQFHDLLCIFKCIHVGQPPEAHFLFLGNYVNYGKYSLEVMTLLFVLMLLHPKSVYLLRGNHETEGVCSRCGFKDEIRMRFPEAPQARKVLSGFIRAFQWMPLCAIVDGQIFCCHGGISPSFLLPPFDPKAGQLANVRTLNSFRKPAEPSGPGLLRDILWSDPMTRAEVVARFGALSGIMAGARWLPNNRRGCSVLFSSDMLDRVMKLFQTSILVRGHPQDVLDNGYLVQHNDRCFTLISAPRFRGVNSNRGCVLQFDRHLDLDPGRPARLLTFLPTAERDPASLDNLFWRGLTDAS